MKKFRYRESDLSTPSPLSGVGFSSSLPEWEREFPSWEGQGVGKRRSGQHDTPTPTPNPSQEGNLATSSRKTLPLKAPNPSQEGNLVCAETSTTRLCFEIEDTGVGIAPEEMEQLFEAFGQTESGRQTQEGTGLGLPISRKFVQLLGGKMTVTSQVERGTLFQFDIQVTVVEDSGVERIQPTRRAIALEPGQPRCRLLIVDDNADNRAVLVKLLHPFGFALREAANGQEAVTLWKAWTPHLIWMDLRMPVMGGYEATKKIRRLETAPFDSVQGDRHAERSRNIPMSSFQSQTKIIALSASVFKGERTVARSNGCDDFLGKPFREQEIFDLMTTHLGVRFIYETETPLDTPDVTDVDLPAALAQIPPDLREQLRYAVRHSDVKLMNRVIDDMCAYQPAAAAVLTAWADNFQYEEILQVLRERPESS